MAKDPAFLFYPGDYLRDTQNLSEKTQVAYDRIMCEHMRNISSDMNNIYLSKKQVDFFTKRLNEDEKDELLFILNKINDGYQIEWVAESIAKRKAYSNSRRENRKNTSKKTSKTYDSHMENENEIEGVIEYLNKKASKKFNIKTDAHRKFINARFKEGFTVDDCKKVIDKKVNEWKGTEMDQYLRPETLFRPSKFEGYLNQKNKQENSQSSDPRNKIITFDK